MQKFFASLLCSLLFFSTSLADVFISPKDRVMNFSNGYCGWCCLETIGNHQGNAKLKNLADNRQKDQDFIEYEWNGSAWIGHSTPKNASPVGAIKEKMQTLGVKCKFAMFDRELLKQETKKDGCVVFMSACSEWHGDHAVLLTEYNDEYVEFINPNDCKYYKATKKWFDTYWYGNIVIIER